MMTYNPKVNAEWTEAHKGVYTTRNFFMKKAVVFYAI